jgi:hypothetical protein
LAQLTPNQKPFCGCWGCLASLRSCEHLPARLQPPRGWADGGRPRGHCPDHSRVPPVGQAACTGDAPMWCDGGGLRGRARRDTIRGQPADSSAPENPGEAHAVEGLVKKTYIIKKELPFSLKELAYLVATRGRWSRPQRPEILRLASRRAWLRRGWIFGARRAAWETPVAAIHTWE